MMLSARVSRWWVIISVSLLAPLLFLLLASVLGRWLAMIREETLGLAPPFFFLHLSSFILVVGGIIWGLGKLRPRDTGFIGSYVRVGLMVMLGVWFCTQVILSVVALIQQGRIQIEGAWFENGWTVFGAFAGNLFGTALFEETTYRGFLLPQLYFKLGGDRARVHRSKLALAALGSALIFSLTHVPALLFGNPTPMQIMAVFLFTLAGGLFGAGLYLRTRNLFVVMGLHALVNAPTPLIETTESVAMGITLGLGLLLIWVWPRITRAIPAWAASPLTRPEETT